MEFFVRLGLAARGIGKRLLALLLLLLAAAGVLVLPNRVGGWVYPLLCGVPLAVAVWRGRGTLTRPTLLWAGYILTFVAFVAIRRLAPEVWGDFAFTRYPVWVDRLIGFGTLPTHWLQRLYSPGEPAWFDWSAVVVHMAYYVAPPLVGGLLMWLAPTRFESYMSAAMLVYGLGLIGYFLVPTVPPWLAGGRGDIPEVHRILFDVWYNLEPRIWHYGTGVAAGNDVAAMPSLHAAVGFLIGVACWPVRGLRWSGIAFAVGTAVALVYLGEHYVVDIAAGGLLVWAAWRLARSARVDRTLAARGGGAR